MYFDLEDLHPETPTVTSAISGREAILISLLVHAVLVIAILLAPDKFFTRQAAPMPLPDNQQIQFVSMEPLVDRPAPPKRPAPPSDIDRKATSPQPIPKPDNTPKAQGNTDEKIIATPEERAKGPETPGPPVPTPTDVLPPINAPSTISSLQNAPAAGSLGESLRNIQKYLKNETFDNPQGGVNDQGPDIQFDSKGADFGPWLRRFKAQVEHNWLIPQSAMTMSGHVVIQFNVHRNGSLTEIQIVKPSTVESFNLAALNALKSSNPTMTLPAGYPSDVCFFTVIFYYNEHPIR